MTKILYGKDIALNIKNNIRLKVQKLNKKHITPMLAIVRIGNKEDDISYEKSIMKNCTSLGIDTNVYELEDNVPQRDVLSLIQKLNKDRKINGILVFRPFPEHLDQDVINSSIELSKDVDCMNPLNLEKIFEGKLNGFIPCTSEAAIETLKYYNIELRGSNIVIINRSMVVGKPLSMMLLSEDATVTIAHSKTKNLSSITKNADIVITAIGRAKMLGEEYFNENSIVVDVSINVDEEGNLCGDVDFDNVNTKLKAITPVPRGIGAVTTSLLLKHIVDASEKQNN
ncbi:bifunctional 5,10-methylenetetrahydrofolate dehydrogenase/5,10-methenyltetrahydrofolate cyclohydrolase [Clostridium niameyense]|uniref:Bifunctional protein FolD n=1 Tax=Clostridium niameyense TaxID=1622073 RepID=A0A6M0R9F1_9CLOT|nr:bifunctional 5,10-methylenetetrahydrofolate dehydrogenase/5,10-methenyltetrahydrofolate cyclohydrolase [Clostridium niameyense]NEZ46895.1 bifunctional 5,10-methylenetetrahydrofolate dehydrogenase/5,10-methenyltetrahydrofolate cyclohydrolase [Clostridium niameyense]